MAKHLLINKDERDKWQLLRRLDEETLKLVKFFVPHHDRLYAALTDNRLLAVGDNANGMLGLGHKNEVKTFEEITTLRGKSIKDIACGWLHVLVLTEEGQVWAWGWNNWGEVGVDNKEPQWVPQLILDKDKDVVSIKCGYVHSLALTREGKLFSWGVNIYGQLGVGNTADQTKPEPMLWLQHEEVVFIGTGPYHSVAVTVGGKAYGWGCNLNHQLGLDKAQLQLSPARLKMQNKLIKSVACSGQNTLFLTHDGLLFVAGDQDTTPRMLPIDKDKQPVEYVLCLDYYYIDENIDKLFVACTSSGHVLQWHDFAKSAEVAPPSTDSSVAGLVATKSKYQYFPEKVCLIKPKEEKVVPKPKAMKVLPTNLHAISHPALTRLFRTQQNYDVVFEFANNQSIRVHRNILSISSPELYSKIPPLSDDQPDQVTHVRVTDYPYSVYYLYLAYLYTVPLPALQLDRLAQLLHLARSKHEVFLQQECICRLSTQLDIVTCCTIYEIAFSFKLKSLQSRALKIIKQNFAYIKDTEEFKQMKEDIRERCLKSIQ